MTVPTASPRKVITPALHTANLLYRHSAVRLQKIIEKANATKISCQRRITISKTMHDTSEHHEENENKTEERDIYKSMDELESEIAQAVTEWEDLHKSQMPKITPLRMPPPIVSGESSSAAEKRAAISRTKDATLPRKSRKQNKAFHVQPRVKTRRSPHGASIVEVR
jgi:hypothetical protein